MNEDEIRQYITTTFAGVDAVEANGDSFFFYNPDPTVPPDHMFPWLTLVTSNFNDSFSDLDRPGVFRLNIGLSKQTFRARFGTPTLPSGPDGAPTGDASARDTDFTALDQVLPHPVYGRQYWACVLNPSDATFATEVQPLLAEAYEQAVSKYQRGKSRAG